MALIDAADEGATVTYRWCIVVGPYTTYAQGTRLEPDGTRSRVYLHRLLLNARPGQMVDHINHNGLDNRRANLRLATRQQNAANRRPSASSGLKGVYRAGSRWYAQINHDGSKRHLGTFATAAEAGQAYDAAAAAAWGDFAYLNERASS